MAIQISNKVMLILAMILIGTVVSSASFADPLADMKQASDLIAAKRYDEAIKLLGSVASADSSLASQAVEMIGDCYRLKEDFGKAAEYYEALLSKYEITGDQGKRVRRWLIKCHIRHKDWSKVENEIAAVAAESPVCAPWSYFSLAKRYQRVGQYDKAIEAFLKAMPADSTLPRPDVKTVRTSLVWSHISAHHWNDASELLKELSAQHPEDAVDWHRCAGAICQGQGKYPEAIEELKQAVDPESATDARKRLGQCYMASLSPADAAPLIQELVDKHPQDGPYLPTTVGKLYQGIGDYGKAIESYDFVITSYPDARWQVWDAFVYKAECLYPSGRGEEALSAIREFYAKHPDRPMDLAIAYGRVYLGCAQKPGEAAKVLEKAVAEHPKDALVRNVRDMLVGAYMTLGQTDKAVENLRVIMDSAKPEEKASLANGVGNIYFQGLRYHEAAAVYHDVLSKPDGVQADILAASTYQLAMCHHNIGLDSNANLYMQRVIEDYPDTRWAGKARTMLSSWEAISSK